MFKVVDSFLIAILYTIDTCKSLLASVGCWKSISDLYIALVYFSCPYLFPNFTPTLNLSSVGSPWFVNLLA